MHSNLAVFNRCVKDLLKNLYVLCLLVAIGCNSPKGKEQVLLPFDKTKWLESVDEDFPYRDLMIRDLMANQNVRGMKWDSVINLLGEPTRSDSNYLFYKVSEQRMGFLTLHRKSLVIRFTADSTVNGLLIHE